MDDQELLARADANYFRSWSLLTAGTPGHEVVEQDGLMLTSGAHDHAAFNLAYLWPSRRPVADRLEATREYFGGKGRPYIVRFRAGSMSGLEGALRKAGFLPTEESDIPGMVHTGLETTAPAEALRIITCRDKAQLASWAKTMAAGYGLPDTLARLFTAPVASGLLDYELYLGFDGDQPVATSGLVLNNGVAGVYLVSTLPDYRRKGYGELLTRHAMWRGHECGALFASLQSSEMGRPLYERMGFRQIAGYRTYQPNPSVL